MESKQKHQREASRDYLSETPLASAPLSTNRNARVERTTVYKRKHLSIVNQKLLTETVKESESRE